MVPRERDTEHNDITATDRYVTIKHNTVKSTGLPLLTIEIK